MQELLRIGKVGITAALAGFSALFGWRGYLVVIWAAAMVLDYATGTAAACKKGDWCSAAARQGLWHKSGMIAAVAVSVLADVALGIGVRELNLSLAWDGMIFPLVLVWYIVTELGSILENAVELGAAVPKWLISLLKNSRTVIDAGKENENENRD